MPVSLQCPKCENSIRLAFPPLSGQKVECPKCGFNFRPPPDLNDEPVPAPKSKTQDEEDRPRRPFGSARDADDRHDSPPPRRTGPLREKDDDAPRTRTLESPPRTRSNREDESRKSPSDNVHDRDAEDHLESSNRLVVFIIAGAGLLLAGGAAVVLVLFGVFASRPDDSQSVDNTPSASSEQSASPKDSNTDSPEQVIPRIKASTVYIKSTFGWQGTGSGSGFCAGAPGCVVTNAHVLGYAPGMQKATAVEVVVHSGEAGERTLQARIHAVNPEEDLALLQVAADALPNPIPFGKAAKLVETEQVIVFGFPYGESLGKSITVARSDVTSIRKEGNRIVTVQLGGGLHPGNSGGPVTNKRGEVIGVSVAKLRASETIAFAIPAEIADAFVRASLGSRPTTPATPSKPATPSEGPPSFAGPATPAAPAPPPLDPRKIATLIVTGLTDDISKRYIEETIRAQLSGMNCAALHTPNGLRIVVFPVDDPKALAAKITVGTVSVSDTTINVTIDKVDLPTPTKEEVAQALSDLKAADKRTRSAAADRLAKCYAPLPDKREEVAKSLESIAVDSDFWPAAAALKALAIWAGPENVKGLAAYLEQKGDMRRRDVITLLGKLKDPASAKALASCLSVQLDRHPAAAALKAIGPPAEKALIGMLDNKDNWAVREACEILKEIGTKESIEPLQKLVDSNPHVIIAPSAKAALKAVQSR